jgi:hypothetical protein
MKKLLLLTAVLIATNTFAQKGKTFPTVIGLTLDGKAMSLPLKNGKETIVAMVFNRSGEDELKKWLNPLYETFMDKSGKKNQMDMSNSYDVNFFFIPAIGGMKMMINQFKSETDKAFWPYIFDTDRTDMKLQKKLLGIEDGGIPYVMVLDKDGKVKEVVSGNVKEDKIDKLEEACGE